MERAGKTGAKAKPWCLLIHADASLSISLFARREDVDSLCRHVYECTPLMDGAVRMQSARTPVRLVGLRGAAHLNGRARHLSHPHWPPHHLSRPHWPARHLSRPHWPPATCHVPTGRPPTCHAPTGRPAICHAPTGRPATCHSPTGRPATCHAHTTPLSPPPPVTTHWPPCHMSRPHSTAARASSAARTRPTRSGPLSSSRTERRYALYCSMSPAQAYSRPHFS